MMNKKKFYNIDYWLLTLLSSNETYRPRTVDKLSLLSMAHQAKLMLAGKFDDGDLQDFTFDGPGELSA
jgi:hypothetical protein